MLWGCSSGKLSSRGLFDPVGAPIHHLRNGAQFVVGNLWDVTDKDLDKLSIDCMTKSFESDCNKKDSKSISEALAIARNVCKMKFAVGSAAVLYGAPLHCTLQK
jgi:separase